MNVIHSPPNHIALLEWDRCRELPVVSHLPNSWREFDGHTLPAEHLRKGPLHVPFLQPQTSHARRTVSARMRYADVVSSSSFQRLAYHHHASGREECDTRSMQGKQDSLLSDHGPIGLSYGEQKSVRVPVKWSEGLRSLL